MNKMVIDEKNAPRIEIKKDGVVFMMTYESVYDYFIEMISLNNRFESNILLKIEKDDSVYNAFDNLYENIKNTELEYCRKPFEKEIIEWMCDDHPENKGDIFRVYKDSDGIYLQMIPNYSGSIFGTVRIRTSGSRYGDYYQYFSHLYNDINDLYQGKNKQKVLK